MLSSASRAAPGKRALAKTIFRFERRGKSCRDVATLRWIPVAGKPAKRTLWDIAHRLFGDRTLRGPDERPAPSDREAADGRGIRSLWRGFHGAAERGATKHRLGCPALRSREALPEPVAAGADDASVLDADHGASSAVAADFPPAQGV